MSNFSKIAKAGKDFACGLYKLQPGALIPNPASKLLVAVWDNLCDYPDSPGLPPPAAPPFKGGQCKGVAYLVDYAGTDERGVAFSSQLGVRYGKIQSVKSYTPNASGTATLFNFIIYSETFDGQGMGEVAVSLYYEPSTQLKPDAEITKVQRIDGNPDNCGDRPSVFPPAPPPPPGGYNSPPTKITFGDNVTNVDLTFNFSPPPPPTVAPGNFMPPVVVNFGQLNVDFKIPIAFNFDGTVNFGSGGSGGGGGGGGDFNQDDRDNINNIKNVTNNTNNTTNNTSTNVDNFYGDYKKDRDRTINKEPLPDDFDPPLPPVPPGKNLVERLAYVDVDLSVIPSNSKSQSGKGAPNILYAGWFEFLRKDKSFPRNYIHFANNCFIAPVGADGYAFTLYNGYQGTAVAITFKE
jgi:hypothetical protein